MIRITLENVPPNCSILLKSWNFDNKLLWGGNCPLNEDLEVVLVATIFTCFNVLRKWLSTMVYTCVSCDARSLFRGYTYSNETVSWFAAISISMGINYSWLCNHCFCDITSCELIELLCSRCNGGQVLCWTHSGSLYAIQGTADKGGIVTCVSALCTFVLYEQVRMLTGYGYMFVHFMS